MDPNLVKIKDTNAGNISKGKLGVPIRQAKDYLQYIHGFHEKNMNKELDIFANEVRELAKSYK